MSLYNGIDPTAVASLGVYSETFGVGEEGNIANLAASFGLFEDAPTGVVGISRRIKWLTTLIKRIRR